MQGQDKQILSRKAGPRVQTSDLQASKPRPQTPQSPDPKVQNPNRKPSSRPQSPGPKPPKAPKSRLQSPNLQGPNQGPKSRIQTPHLQNQEKENLQRPESRAQSQSRLGFGARGWQAKHLQLQLGSRLKIKKLLQPQKTYPQKPKVLCCRISGASPKSLGFRVLGFRV